MRYLLCRVQTPTTRTRRTWLRIMECHSGQNSSSFSNLLNLMQQWQHQSLNYYSANHTQMTRTNVYLYKNTTFIASMHSLCFLGIHLKTISMCSHAPTTRSTLLLMSSQPHWHTHRKRPHFSLVPPSWCTRVIVMNFIRVIDILFYNNYSNRHHSTSSRNSTTHQNSSCPHHSISYVYEDLKFLTLYAFSSSWQHSQSKIIIHIIMNL